MQTLPIRIGFFKENYGYVKNGERNAYEIKKSASAARKDPLFAEARGKSRRLPFGIKIRGRKPAFGAAKRDLRDLDQKIRDRDHEKIKRTPRARQNEMPVKGRDLPFRVFLGQKAKRSERKRKRERRIQNDHSAVLFNAGKREKNERKEKTERRARSRPGKR